MSFEAEKAKESKSRSRNDINGQSAGAKGRYLTDNRTPAFPMSGGFDTSKKGNIAQHDVIQRITHNEAAKAKQDERLVWYEHNGKYSEVRVTGDLIAEDTNAAIRKMDGSSAYVPLTALHLLNPLKHQGPQIAVKGAATPGLSKPIPGENMIHRGIVETEMVNGKAHVRVYSALMGSASFDTEDSATGEATSKFKDIHQHKDGSILISTGQNSVLWGNMGRPLRTVKWSEKYFAQIIEEKPELKPDYERYLKAINDLDNSGAILKVLQDELKPLQANLNKKNKQWNTRKKTPTKNQSKNIGLAQKKVSEKETKISAEKLLMERNKNVIEEVRSKMAKSANPIIRSFLIPFSSFEKMSKNALPERLHGVVPKVEKLAPIVEHGGAGLTRMEYLLNAISAENQKENKLQKEIKRLRGLKSATKNQHKRLITWSGKLARRQEAINKYKLEIVAEFHKFESATNVEKSDRTKEKNHARLHEQLKQKYLAAYAEIKKLKERAMPDLGTEDFTAAGVLAEMKKRKLDKGSINVDVHYEPNQFGLHGDDLEALRKDAVKGSLVSYAMFPDKLTAEQKAASGKLHGIDHLRRKLGIPLKSLAKNPWLSGSGFAKKNEFKGKAGELSEYYATWQKMKNPHFKDDAFIEGDQSKIPFKRRKEMLLKFFSDNNVSLERRAEFMEKVVSPWASQSMIAHIMASDFDAMNEDPSLKKRVPSQDFDRMRANLPMERSRNSGKG